MNLEPGTVLVVSVGVYGDYVIAVGRIKDRINIDVPAREIPDGILLPGSFHQQLSRYHTDRDGTTLKVLLNKVRVQVAWPVAGDEFTSPAVPTPPISEPLTITFPALRYYPALMDTSSDE